MATPLPPALRPTFLPFHQVVLHEEDKQEVQACLNSGWLTTGPRVQRFEEAFAAFTGRKHAIALNSCTAALHLALVASGLKPGDEVITPSLNFPSATNAMIHEGITPVFIDVDPPTLNLDTTRLAHHLSARTKAILPVHFAGHPVQQDSLRQFAYQHGLYVLGDAAHATESRFKDQHVSAYEDATAYSFYATKNLATGEGGMLTTDNDDLAEQARILSLHGMSRDAWKRYTDSGYKHWDIIAPGFKYNMPDLTAALGLHQLKRLTNAHTARRKLAQTYTEAFSDLKDYVLGLTVDQNVDAAYHLYVLILKSEHLTFNRDDLLAHYQKFRIGVGVHFRAIHQHPWYQQHLATPPNAYPHTNYASDRVFSLPLYPTLSPQDQAYIIDVTRYLILSHRR